MFLKELSEARGVSSREHEVRDLIREYITPHVDEVFNDSLGNLYGVKGKDKPGPKVMLAAHMDEVGLMITTIEKNGLLRFQPVIFSSSLGTAGTTLAPHNRICSS
jgi:putative aminopeptidase FrvX